MTVGFRDVFECISTYGDFKQRVLRLIVQTSMSSPRPLDDVSEGFRPSTSQAHERSTCRILRLSMLAVYSCWGYPNDNPTSKLPLD